MWTSRRRGVPILRRADGAEDDTVLRRADGAEDDTVRNERIGDVVEFIAGS
jgi:hypothetical protein